MPGRRLAVVFPDRRDAGRRLAAKLGAYRSADPIVLALPRGGVPVAEEVASALDAPLDVLVVRKVGAPGHPELAIGAVAPGILVLDDPAIRRLDVPAWYLERAIRRARREVARRARQYRGTAAAADLAHRTVIIVDDGIATCSTALAAVDAARRLGATRIAVAVPIASRDAIAKLRERADDVACVAIPPELRAVGFHYADFRQLSDNEVRRVVERARGGRVHPIVEAS